jgi:hypothetical protein
MRQSSLAGRVKALESRVAELAESLPSAQAQREKDWRRTIGAFTDDEGLKEILQEALRLREIDRKKTRPK